MSQVTRKKRTRAEVDEAEKQMIAFVKEYYQREGRPPTARAIQDAGYGTILRSRYSNRTNLLFATAGIAGFRASSRLHKSAEHVGSYSVEEPEELAEDSEPEYEEPSSRELRSVETGPKRRKPSHGQQPHIKVRTYTPPVQAHPMPQPRELKVTQGLLSELASLEGKNLREYDMTASVDSYKMGDRLRHNRFGAICVVAVYPDLEQIHAVDTSGGIHKLVTNYVR